MLSAEYITLFVAHGKQKWDYREEVEESGAIC